MNNCTVCDDGFRNDKANKIICDGSCRQVFHAECVNFNKDALFQYRQMPNLQWFCDSCIIQMRSSNVSYVSSNRFNKLNSTSFARTSSPPYVQSSLLAANRQRKPIRGAKQATSSMLLANEYPTVNRYTNKSNDCCSPTLKHQTRPENQKAKSPDANKSHPPTTYVINQSDVACPEPKHTRNLETESENQITESTGANESHPQTASIINQSDVAQLQPPHNYADGKETHKEPLELNESTSSYAEVVTKSSITKPAPAEVVNSMIKPQSDSTQSRRDLSPQFETRKVAYVSKVHRDTTEGEMVNYLIRCKAIRSAEDVSCTKLISPNVDLNSVSFVPFKISGSSEMYRLITEEEFWPGTGGLLNLFMGFSIISIVEIFYYATLRPYCKSQRLRRVKNSMEITIGEPKAAWKRMLNVED